MHWSDLVDGPLQVLSVSLTCWNVVYFRISFIAFCIVWARYIIDRNNTSCLIILGYVPKTSKVGTNLLESTKLLIALKDIWNAKPSLILEILIVIIV